MSLSLAASETNPTTVSFKDSLEKREAGKAAVAKLLRKAKGKAMSEPPHHDERSHNRSVRVPRTPP